VGERECSILILSVEHKESNSAFPRPTPPTSKPAKKHTSFYQCVGSILCKNRREREVLERFESQGFKALKKGWPDFLFYKDGEIVMVEVKETTTTYREDGTLHSSARNEENPFPILHVSRRIRRMISLPFYYSQLQCVLQRHGTHQNRVLRSQMLS
jgi:hypothetical protein